MQELLQDPTAWDAVAASYDEAARRLLTPFSEEAVRWADVGEEDDVLDVACGPGTTTVLAARRARSVTAVDFSPAMIAALERHCEGLSHVQTHVGDGQALPLADERFSAAFSMFGLMFFPDPIAGLRELHRVLRPGGRVVISSWVPRSRSPMMQPLGAAVMHAVPPDPDAPPTPFPFDSSEALARGLEEGGFTDVEVREHTPTHTIESAEQYWHDARGNIFIRRLRERSGEAWPGLEEKILEHLRGSLADVRELAMPGLIGLGRKGPA